jgi:outer membrane receptor protein involved in Fe transport
VESRSPFRGVVRPDAPRSDRTDLDYLPGAALKYQLGERMLVRGAYGMTLARPQIRELAPYDYYDFLRERGVVGNPELRRTFIHNADLRWEWFFGEGEIVAASTFYKRFIDPIELAILDNVTGSSQFRNGTAATNLGGELELRLNLGRLARPLRRFAFDGNLALVRSRIELPPDLTAVRSTRPLAGQSPYVANVSLRFNEDIKGIAAALVYNVVGPRIVDVATLLGDVIPPDIEEATFHSLDFVGGARVGRHMKLKLKIRNILLQKRELRQGDFLIQRAEPGISASFGITVSY